MENTGNESKIVPSEKELRSREDYLADNYTVSHKREPLDSGSRINKVIGGFCSDEEVNRVPIYEVTPEGVRVLNRIPYAYFHQGHPDDPKCGYTLAFYLWFESLQAALINISNETEVVDIAFAKDSDQVEHIEYQITIKDDSIVEASILIESLPSIVETYMKEISQEALIRLGLEHTIHE